MDHAYVEEHGLIERYHQGALPPEEEARFEEHFAGCAQCLELLVLDRGLRRGLRAVAAEEGARAARLGLLAWIARRSRGVQAGLLVAALFVAAALPSAFFLTRTPPGGLASPRGDTPLFLLHGFRGDPGEPAATIDLARVAGFLVLAVEVDDDPRFAGYRVTVTGADGAALFRQADLRPNAFESLMITCPAGFFAPGDYRLRVEGVDDAGAGVEVGGYPFRVVDER